MSISIDSGITILRDVTTLNGLGGDISLASADGSIVITPSGSIIDLSATTALGGYIKKDGTTTTTAQIPFAEGISVPVTKEAFFGGTSSANAEAGIITNANTFLIRGFSNTVTGTTIKITGGDAPFDGSAGFVRLHGGSPSMGGDTPIYAFVTTSQSIIGFTFGNNIAGASTLGNSLEDFSVGGKFYGAGSSAFAGGIGLYDKLVLTGYSLLTTGDSAQIIAADRANSGAGSTLTIQSAWAQFLSTNQNAGNLILAPGKATGTGTASTLIQATGGGSSGTTDQSPTTVITVAHNLITNAQTLQLRTGSATAGTGPLRFTSGTLLSAPVVGIEEFLTDKRYTTITTGTARKEYTLNDGTLTSGRVPFATTNGRLTDSSTFTFDGTNLSLANSLINTASAGGTTEGQTWNDTTQKARAVYQDAIKQMLVGCIFTQTADQTVSNTVTETTILGTGVGTKTLPANFFVAGKTIRLRVGGVYTTPALATPSIIIRVKYGATVIATVTTTALLSGATNLEFDGEVLITCRTTGASGTVMTHGDVEYATGVAGTIAVDPLNNAGVATTINTTTSNALDVTVQWDSATSTRSVMSTTTTIEVVN